VPRFDCDGFAAIASHGPKAWEDSIARRREFLDEQFMFRLVNMKTHPKVGDMPVVKLLEVGYKRTGDIQAVKVSNQASAGVAIAPRSTMKEIYKSQWLRDKEAQLAAECEKRVRRQAPPSGTAEPTSE
jgi:hypothetical protein